MFVCMLCLSAAIISYLWHCLTYPNPPLTVKNCGLKKSAHPKSVLLLVASWVEVRFKLVVVK